jgi:hypothetical protein
MGLHRVADVLAIHFAVGGTGLLTTRLNAAENNWQKCVRDKNVFIRSVLKNLRSAKLGEVSLFTGKDRHTEVMLTRHISRFISVKRTLPIQVCLAS